MEDALYQLGVPAIVALLILDRVFAFLKARKDGIDGALTDDKTKRMVAEMHRLHNVKDGDGVPVWYVRRSLEKTIEGQTTVLAGIDRNITKQTAILSRLVEKVDSLAS